MADRVDAQLEDGDETLQLLQASLLACNMRGQQQEWPPRIAGQAVWRAQQDGAHAGVVVASVQLQCQNLQAARMSARRFLLTA